MFFFMTQFLHDFFGIHIPAAFSYYSTRMLLAALTSLIISIFIGPYFIKKLYELKIGQTIRTDECPLLGQLHEKKKNTPTMGGILILFSMLASMFLWMDLKNVFTLLLFITTLFLGGVGARDDYLKLKYKNTKGLSARKKMAAQILLVAIIGLYLLYPPVSEWIHVGSWYAPPTIKEYQSIDPNNLGFATNSTSIDSVLSVSDKEDADSREVSLQDYATRLYVPFFKDPVLSFSGIYIIIAVALIFFVVVGSSNGVNLTDGLDGLAAGSLIIVAACLGLIAFMSNHLGIATYLHILYIEGSGEIAIYMSAFVGACLGFLWYNSHPAQVFMGDTGSLALGGIIGVSALLLKRELLLAIIGGIFVAETLSVILQVSSYRYRNKKRIFLCAPLHHHFEYQGWAETKVVTRFWIIGLLLAIIGIASLKFQ